MRRPSFHQEAPEHSKRLRAITLAMSWMANIALIVATGDAIIVVLLSLVITGGHWVSWRTRTWKSYRWQLLLLFPISAIGLLLVPTLPGALQGDWMHPMRYLLTLQGLSAYYLHSRASLYTSHMLSTIVLLVASQLAFDSLFLAFFFGFFFVALLFLAGATSRDQTVTALGSGRWPGWLAQAAGMGAAALAVIVLGAAMFMVLPWGSLHGGSAAGSVLPLTGTQEQVAGTQDQGTESGGGGSQPGPGQGEATMGGGEPDSLLPLTGAPVAPEDAGNGPTAGADAPIAGGVPGDIPAGGGESGTAPMLPPDASPTLPNDATFEPFDPAEFPDGADNFAGAPPQDTTVMQVRSPVTSYWRGRTYSTFDGNHWLPDPPGAAFEQSRVNERRQYTQTVFLRQAQDVPLMGYSSLAVQVIGSDSDAPGLDAGAVYRVLSERRNFHPSTLAARGGVPSERGRANGISERVWTLANQITAGEVSRSDRALAVTQYLRSNYTYVESPTPFEPAQTVEQFLFGSRRIGTALDFAAAQTALAVGAGLDARMVTGYLPGEFDPLSGSYVVRDSDAHAWTEVYMGGRAGWVPFDGNPRPDGQAQETTRGGAAGAVAGLFQMRLGDDVRDAVGGALKVSFERLLDAWRPIVAVLATAAALWLAYSFARRWRRSRPPGYSNLDGAARREVLDAYAGFVRRVRRSVAQRMASETIGDYFGRVAAAAPLLARELSWLRGAVQAAAYAPLGPGASEASDARRRFAAAARSVRSAAH